MNAKSIKLLDILSACQSEDEGLAKMSKVAVIEQMPAYQELAHRNNFREEFDKFLTKEKLTSFTAEQLNQIQMALPSIPDCIDNIMYSLKNGDGPQLTADDRPDFTDKASVDALSSRLEDSSGKNYTNIPLDEFMAIFDDATVKSIGNQFDVLPHPCADYGAALQKLFGNTRYCISEAELKSRDQEYAGKLDRFNRTIGEGKFIRFRHRVIKAVIGLLFIVAPAIVAGATGWLDSSMQTMVTVIMLIAVIVYWVKG
jgi:hypothetical protein